MQRLPLCALALALACACDPQENLSPDVTPPEPTLQCVPGTLQLQRAVASVMFVLDRSGSMESRLGTSTRWESLTETLASQLPSLEGRLDVGALLFPRGAGDLGCTAPSTANLAPAPGNVQPLLESMRSTSPAGATPTADAIDSAAKNLASVDTPGVTHVMVLATDGAPGCNGALDGRTCTCLAPSGCDDARQCLDDERTVSRIAWHASVGLPTYVIGIADGNEPVFTGVLERMALAGGRARTGADHAYYAATSEAELGAALADVHERVSACVYLTTSVPDEKGTIRVTLDGEPVPGDDENGWSWGDRRRGEIVLRGAACDAAIASEAPHVVAAVTCGSAGK